MRFSTLSHLGNKWLFGVVLIILLSYRIWILHSFGIKYTDSDQSIMWLGAVDYANGEFHEPRFYGQDYNSMLESLLAVPFYKIGLPIHIAVPLATSILAIFPYIFLGLLAGYRRSASIGTIILLIPLLLPFEYDLLTSISRGFVTGIAVTIIIAFVIFFPRQGVNFAIAGLLAVLGYSINANSIIISAPILFYLFLQNIQNRIFYLLTFFGISLGLIFHYFVQSFYLMHPSYALHKYQISASLNNLLIGLAHLDKYLNWLTPIFWKQGWVLLVFFVASSFILYKKKKFNESIVVLSIPFLIVLPLAVSKLHDGTDSIFFPFSRMYLSVPVLIGIVVLFFGAVSRKLVHIIILLALVIVTYKIYNSKEEIQFNIVDAKIVSVISVKELYEQCKQINKISKENDVELIVINNHWFYDFYDFACPACIQGFPKTLRPTYERRTWRLIEDENCIYHNILFIDTDRSNNQDWNMESIEGMFGFYLLRNNTSPTMELLEKLGIEVREY